MNTTSHSPRLLPSCLPLSTSSCLQFNSRLVQPTKWPQDIHQKHNPFDGRQEMAKDGYGVTLFDINDGKVGPSSLSHLQLFL